MMKTAVQEDRKSDGGEQDGTHSKRLLWRTPFREEVSL